MSDDPEVKDIERLLELLKSRKPATILLVDDDVDFCSLMVSLFEDERFYNIATTYSGESALHVLEEGYKPDLILLDLRLTGMDGVEVLRRIREKDQETTVAFFTGAPNDERLLRASDYGPVTIIPKPPEIRQLKSLVKGLANVRLA